MCHKKDNDAISMNPLYQALSNFLMQTLLWKWSAETRHRFVLLIMGVLLAKSTRPSQMAKALCQYGISDAQESSVQRQFRRIFKDDHFSATTTYQPFIQVILRQHKPDEIVCIIDATTHTDQFLLLMVAIYYRGRAIPLVWDMWEANVPLKGARFWERVQQLIQRTAILIPQQTRVIWLADRAFGTPQFTDLLTPYGWHFVVRVQGQTRFADRMGHETRIDHLATRKARFKGQGRVFKSAGWRGLGVVVWRSRHHRQLLCLVSDLEAEYELVTLYRQRFAIECLFRDYKSQGWCWEQSQVRHMKHVGCLLVAMAFATSLCLLAGTQVAQECLDKPASGKRLTLPPEARHSFFQHGLTRLLAWACHHMKRPLIWCLHGWDRYNWQNILRRHHIYPTIFGKRKDSDSVVKVRPP